MTSLHTNYNIVLILKQVILVENLTQSRLYVILGKKGGRKMKLTAVEYLILIAILIILSVLSALSSGKIDENEEAIIKNRKYIETLQDSAIAIHEYINNREAQWMK